MRRASKGYTGVDIPLFPTMLVQGPVVQGEGSTVLVESHHTTTSASSTLQPPSSSPFRRTTRQESVVPQPRSPTQTNVADKAASIGVDVRHGGAATTVTSLDAGHGSGNIDKTPSMPHNLPLPRVHTLGSDEGRMQHNKLMDLVTKLFDRVVALEQTCSRQRKSMERHDMESDFEFTATEEVYTTEKGVSTAEPVSTAGASVSTAGASSAKDKGKAIMEEAETIQTKTKLQLEQERLGYEEALRLQAEIDEEERQRIARVQEEASSFNIEEWDDIQARVEADEEFAQRLQSEEREMYSEAEKARLLAELINERKRYFAAQRAEERRNKPLTQAQQRTYMSQYIKNMGSHTLKQLKSYSFDEIKNLFETTMRRVHTFVPMESESERVIPELAAGSSKRDAEEELVQESSKRLKTGESSVPAEEPKDK
ncbi:hypothetical protein Tco_1092654 [Tanacetum coccineum]|uniref:Uncharacterized protein n=1 Tax=Tanacetum coccineum TaxID=301880 RepID=A0ABQ5IBQ5_9ASTR